MGGIRTTRVLFFKNLLRGEIERFFEQKLEAPLLSKETIGKQNIVLFDRDRNGIFIHRDWLVDRPFTIGDRFSIHKGRRELFSLKIKKDDQGDIQPCA